MDPLGSSTYEGEPSKIWVASEQTNVVPILRFNTNKTVPICVTLTGPAPVQILEEKDIEMYLISGRRGNETQVECDMTWTLLKGTLSRKSHTNLILIFGNIHSKHYFPKSEHNLVVEMEFIGTWSKGVADLKRVEVFLGDTWNNTVSYS